MTKLFNIDANAKTVKGQAKGYMTGILYLAPARLSGHEVCPGRSDGCTAACLNTAGRGVMTKVQEARIRKTKWFFKDRASFMGQLVKDMETLMRKSKREGLTPCVRLNGTSDIPWEKIPVMGQANIMTLYPNVQFYDYTKRHNRCDLPFNYHLTFSLSESNDYKAAKALATGMNVAVVFRNGLPKTFELCGITRPVIDGDVDDVRFATLPQGFVSTQFSGEGFGSFIGLKAKGKAKQDQSGFVRDIV